MENKPFFSTSGIIEAPFQQVLEVMMNAHPGPVGPDNALYLYNWENQKWVLKGGPRIFHAVIPGDIGGGMRYEIDPEKARIITEGMWWFRGICAIEPHQRGARIRQEGYDIASKAKFLVPFLKRGAPKKRHAANEQLYSELGRQLHCKVYAE